MKTKKCMWCLKEFETDLNEQYCSDDCRNKNDASIDKTNNGKTKKGIFGGIFDAISSLFS